MAVYQINQKKRNNILSNLSVNTLLILLNIFFFVVAIILFSVDRMIVDFIALKPSNIFQGEYLWTFLASMFMHGGFFHLFVNMLSLMFVGSLVEKLLGKRRYIWFYLLAGLFAGLFFVFWEFLFPTNPDIAAVGASGALFGLIGFLMIITPNLPVYIMFIPIPIKMKYAAPGILIALWLISAAPMVFGGEQLLIGNTAHLGGLIAGFIYGVYIKMRYKNKARHISKHFS